MPVTACPPVRTHGGVRAGTTGGLRKCLDLLSIFPDNPPSTRCAKRWRQLDAIETAGPAEVEASFNRATDVYHDLPHPSDAAFWSVIERRVGAIGLPCE